MSSLPQTLSGTIQNFITEQTVTFRLDNTSGPLLTGSSISPDPVPNSGTASVSVTIPAGPRPARTTVYAIGNQGDVASAAITRPAPRRRSRPRPGTSPTHRAARADNLLGAAFARRRSRRHHRRLRGGLKNRYYEVRYNAPLRSGRHLGVNFNFNFAATQAGDNACFYFEVRRSRRAPWSGPRAAPQAPSAVRPERR